MARLVFNGGSSSWKCGLYDVRSDARAIDAGDPLARANLSWSTPAEEAIDAIFAALQKDGVDLRAIEAVGHRIVHGADEFARTTWLDGDAVARLTALEPFAPAHNPIELAAVAAVRKRLPDTKQYAVFDTQFHRTMREDAYTYPGPYAWREKKIRKYGFHGTSVAYATERITAELGRDPHDTQLIVAHLGGGCSVTAVKNGASVDTSMGFTPLDGTMMGTRSGAIDPAIAIYLMREAAKQSAPPPLTDFANALDRTLNHESGLAGISGISGDMRELTTAAEHGNMRAELAIDLFVYRLAATIGSLLPALDRLDAIVFTGGIGEHAERVRERTTARFAYLFSNAEKPVRTCVVTAREEWYIAREGARLSP